MLKEIRCDKLKDKKIEFNKDLNIILGPNNSSNSIGKSSILMLIDFAFGGEDFIKKYSEITDNIGHFSVTSIFEFDHIYTFTRNTETPNEVEFEGQPEASSIDQFRDFLKLKYFPINDAGSFRGRVNLFSRIWKKDNDDPLFPLQEYKSQSFSHIRQNILKLFERYGIVSSIERKYQTMKARKNTLRDSFKHGFIEEITTKKALKNKKDELIRTQEEIKTIKSDFELYSVNIQSVVTKRNYELKHNKDILIKEKSGLNNRKSRIEQNIGVKTSVTKRSFQKLIRFFPNVNASRLNRIESFHSGVSKILEQQLKNELDEINSRLTEIDEEISKINQSLHEILSSTDKSEFLIDRVLDLATTERTLSRQVEFRELKESISQKIKELSDEINTTVESELKNIEESINTTMETIIKKLYHHNPTIPTISIGKSNYEFNHYSDSGTGKAFVNLIVFDLSILHLTFLPFLIHDTTLFNDIEKDVIEKLIEQYNSFPKQTFISIDGAYKFSSKVKKIISNKEVISLSREHPAFGKLWGISSN